MNKAFNILHEYRFTESRVFFQTLPPANNGKNSVVRNTRDFVFQVWPKLNYEAHKEFRRNEKALNFLKASEDVSKDPNLAQYVILQKI
jgi:uncharacterized protein (UPF0147 family)